MGQLTCGVQVRYRSKPVAATVMPIGRYRTAVLTEEPLRAVTPGQAGVFYRDDLVLGGGWIAREQD
jgi:tRNA-specific 2-thiouridylase